MPAACYIFSSNPDNGAINRTPDGSRFSISLTNPLYLPENAYNAKLEVIQANIWNNSPNISQSLGNNEFTIYDDIGSYTATVSDGLYDVDTLYDSLAVIFDNMQGTRPQAPFKDIFDFQGNESTNRLSIVFKYSAAYVYHIDWYMSTMREILGFNINSPSEPVIPPNASHNTSITAPDASIFNAYNSFVIHTDLVNTGIQLNNNFSQIICQLPITSNPGELETYKSSEPNIFSLCNELIGLRSAKYNVSFWLTSETNVPLDTRGEYYDLVLQISWLEAE